MTTTPATLNYLKHVSLTALAYFVLGHAGLALAIPPGYASPIFPAAGMGVAALLCFGRGIWPGITLGSLLLNLTASGSSDSHYVVACCIAIGSTLQCLTAAVLIERVSDQRWREMESPADITQMLMIAGPVCSVISASAGVSALYFAGITPKENLLFTWWNWWMGDTLGVLVALPLSLTFLLRERFSWRARQIALGLPMLTALGVIATAYVAVSRYERSTQELAIRDHGEQLSKRLEQRFIAHEEALAALKRLIEVTPDMRFAQFEYFTRITLKENPDVFALSFNPYVRLSERAAFEKRMAATTQKADFEIKERNAEKRLIRAAERADYVVVGYIAPLKGNQPAIGYDINSEPIRQDAIRRARQSQTLSVTATIQLVQENQKRVGALLLYPAYAARSSDQGATNDSQLIGFAVGVIKLDEMVEIATDKVGSPDIAFRLEDITDGRRDLVFRSANEGTPGTHATSLKLPLTIADRTWELTVHPTAAYQATHRSWFAWLTGVVGLLLASLLQVLLLVTTGQTAVAERNIKKQHARLATQDAELRDRTALINTLFDLSPDGFVAFGADGKIRFANPAFYSMTGLLAEDTHRHSIETLDRYLRQSADPSENYHSIEHLFDATDGNHKARITLACPRHAVLEISGVKGIGIHIDRFAYFRDVTHEAEVDRMKSEFLSHAAHELRTPMASIYGFSELLIHHDFDEETRKDLLTTIHKQTAWLVEIINELLDLARIEARRGKDFEITSVDIPAILRDVIDSMQIDARWPLTIEIPQQIPPVAADVAKLRQAITNIVGNAVKYSPAGGAIAIQCSTRQENHETFVGLTVSDHGIGMTMEQAAHVGERFYRADTSGNIPGSGLGMAIVKEMLELLRGKLEVSSEPGRGTRITLWLPSRVTTTIDQ